MSVEQDGADVVLVGATGLLGAEVRRELANRRFPVRQITMMSAGDGEEVGQIVDSLAPQGNEPVVEKKFPNAFVETDLEARLKEIGRQDIVLVGFMTHMCISSTVRAAFNLGYRSTVVAAATATRDLPGTAGSVIEADVLQEASLAGIGDLFALVVPGQVDVPD